ncbi:MAG TPA: hypothetical protein PLI51_04580 [bacterium]|nr:hypothetical protein [bacterium]HPQ65986.1 hypothetical protein [bacterium]
MSPDKKHSPEQTEFPFMAKGAAGFLRSPSPLLDLGTLPAAVLLAGVRPRKWMAAHGIETLADLVAVVQSKDLSQKCLDQQVRNKLQDELKAYWNGKQYIYIFGINFVGKGVERVLCDRKLRRTSIRALRISPHLIDILERKKIRTVGDLLLQPELQWRNPRSLGNLLVDEILVALAEFVLPPRS